MKMPFLTVSCIIFTTVFSSFADQSSQSEKQDRVIYKDIIWKPEYHNITPPQQDPSLPNSFLMDDLAWVRVKMDPVYQYQIYKVYDQNGECLYSISVHRHSDTDYLKAYLVKMYLVGDYHPIVAQYRRTHIPSTIYTHSKDGLILTGFMPSDCEFMPQFQKYPKKKSLLLYIHDGYGIENNTAYDRTTPATPEEELALFKRFIAVCKGEIPVQHDDAEIERRQKLYSQLIESRWHELEKNTTEYAKKEWDRIAQEEPRQFTRIFWDNANYGRGIERILKLEDIPERNTIPNINTGVGCEPFLAELIQKGFQLTARKGGNYLMTATIKDKKTSIRYCIYHAFNPVDARQTLFAWNMYADERGTPRIVEKPGDFTMQAAIDNMNVRPGWVGDFDISTKPRFNWEGSLVEGSEKSAVYFMRGNTAAYFIADNPSYNVLPLARMLDQQLKKGLEQAPNTSEEKEEPQLERQDPIIYKDILWKLEYHNIAPPLQDTSLPNSFLLDDLAWVRGKVDPSYTWHSQTYNIYNKNGEFLYSISVYRHHDTDYLKAYMIKNYINGGGNPSIAQTRRTHMQATTYSNNQEGLVLSGFMPGEFEIMPQFQKYPKKKSLLLYIHDGYGIENYTAYDRITPATPEEELALFKRFIAVCKGEIPVQHDDAEIERRQKLYSQLIESRWHELEKKHDGIHQKTTPTTTSNAATA